MKTNLSIGIMGSRGIPNAYGGFEECAQEVGKLLAEKGHHVSVYCSSLHPDQSPTWQNVNRIICHDPEDSFGSFGQFLYDRNCLQDASNRDFDVLFHLGYTSDAIWTHLWPKGMQHAINMDGLEWKRSKYPFLVRRFLRWSERRSAKRAEMLVADSLGISEHLQKEYARPVAHIAYGAWIPDRYDEEVPLHFELQAQQYDLMIARMEPENQLELAIEAKMRSNDGIPLFIVGNKNAYRKKLIRKYGTEDLIRIEGPVYQPEITNSLRHFCRFYIHGHSVGGTNPSLLEAMACGATILAHDNPFNKGVTGKNAYYFSSRSELTQLFDLAEEQPMDMIQNNLSAIQNQYNWEVIAHQYEQLCYELVEK